MPDSSWTSRWSASIFANQIHDFTPRLPRALNYPKTILPTHWDNFEKPYSEGPKDLRDVFGDPANLDLWVKEAKQISPKSRVVVLKFCESFYVGGGAPEQVMAQKMAKMGVSPLVQSIRNDQLWRSQLVADGRQLQKV